MLRALEVKLYPNNKQINYLNIVFGCYRKIYNICLSKSINNYEKGEKFNSLFDFSKYFHKEIINNEEFNYFKQCNTKILKDSMNNLSQAFSNYFKSINKQDGYSRNGFPNFKKRTGKQNIGLYKEAFSKKIFEIDNFMFISKKFGLIKYKTSPEYKKIIKQYKNNINRIIIKKTKSNEYFAIISIDYKETTELPANKRVIGVDLGLKNFIVTSDGDILGEKILNKKFKNKIKKIQRQLNKKQLIKTEKTYFDKKLKINKIIKEPSKNFEKCRIKLAKVYGKIRNKKKNELHKITKQLLNDNQVIVMENLNVIKMLTNNKVSGSLQYANFGEFKIILKYKADWYGREIIEINRFFPSTKLCNCCGHKNNNITLNDRVWLCPICGEKHDRDINAAINIKNEGLRIIGSQYPK
jgi:putative transposase